MLTLDEQELLEKVGNEILRLVPSIYLDDSRQGILVQSMIDASLIQAGLSSGVPEVYEPPEVLHIEAHRAAKLALSYLIRVFFLMDEREVPFHLTEPPEGSTLLDILKLTMAEVRRFRDYQNRVGVPVEQPTDVLN